LLHENVDDELRGRIFASLLVLVRFCVLIALAIAPILSELLDGLSDSIWGREIVLGGLAIFVPGVRLTMWISAIIIAMAGGLAMWSLRAGSGAFLTEAESEPSS
jgi:hypothetical protein